MNAISSTDNVIRFKKHVIGLKYDDKYIFKFNSAPVMLCKALAVFALISNPISVSISLLVAQQYRRKKRKMISIGLDFTTVTTDHLP
jgi:hypothetical protein